MKKIERQVEALQSLNLIDQQMQIYLPQIKLIKDLFPLGAQLKKICIEELQKHVAIEQNINRDNLIYKTGNTKNGYGN